MIRIAPRLISAAAALVWFALPAAAQNWTERLYNPEVGSRWSITSRTDTDETRAAGDRRDRHATTRSELTIDERLSDGFRISFVMRELSITGNAPGTEIASAALGAMKDIVIRARTDASGKPVAIENIDEVRANMRTVIERLAKGFERNPGLATFMTQFMSGMLTADGAQAAELYVFDVSLLASGQNTGLRPGATQRKVEEMPSPLGGGALKSALVTRLTSWDDATGKAQITVTREMDQASMKAAVLALSQQVMAAAGTKDAPQITEMMKNISLDIQSETKIDVENGMTKMVAERSTTTASLMGRTFRKLETKVLAVTPLPK